MTKRIFRSIVIASLIVLLAALLLIVGVLYSHFTDAQFDQLRAETALVAQAVNNEGQAYFQGLDRNANCRITWIAADGSILFDNRSDTAQMENHAERAEVTDARNTGYGQCARYSATLTERYLYAAQRLPDGTILRLSGAQSTVLNLLAKMLSPLLPVTLAAVILSLFLANRLSKSIVQPLNDLNLSQPIGNTGYAEIRPLLRRLDAQQIQLRGQALELAQMKTEFETVTRGLNEGLVLLSGGGAILSINPAAARLLEVTPNCAGADFTAANQNSDIAALADAALHGEKGEKILPLAGKLYLVSASPVKSGSYYSGAVLFLLDVTEKQQAETLRREFTANVSHELKTPLHAISGYAELMKSGMVSSEDIPRFSEKLYGETRRLIALVEDILRLSRLDEGGEDMQKSAVDLFALAQSTAEALSPAAELAEVTLSVQGEKAVVFGVPQLLSTIIFNLTDNAVKYNRPGGSVTVSVTEDTDGIRMEVSDTGVGIPPEDRERIFERFYRVDKSRSKEVGGTGLGLSIVKHAAKISGATLSVSGVLGRGTDVCVVFPK